MISCRLLKHLRLHIHIHTLKQETQDILTFDMFMTTKRKNITDHRFASNCFPDIQTRYKPVLKHIVLLITSVSKYKHFLIWDFFSSHPKRSALLSI